MQSRSFFVMLLRPILLASVAAAAIAPLNNPCLDSASPYAKQPWCNATLPIDLRVADMVSRMTIAEKIANLDTQAPEIGSLGLNAYNWWSGQ